MRIRLCLTFMNEQNRDLAVRCFSQNNVEMLEFSWEQGRDLATWLISNNTFHVDAKYIFHEYQELIDFYFSWLKCRSKQRASVLYEYIQTCYTKSSRNCCRYVYKIRKFVFLRRLLKKKISRRIRDEAFSEDTFSCFVPFSRFIITLALAKI